MNIEEKIIYYKKSLDCFEETMDKYKFLLEQGNKTKPFPEEYRQDNFKVSGCQAQVWLVPYIRAKKLYFYFDSDAFISKGMITILCDIYGGRDPKEIVSTNFNLLDSLELNSLLTPSRRNGVHSMLLKIREYAKSYI